jgi:hypothetical protein
MRKFGGFVTAIALSALLAAIALTPSDAQQTPLNTTPAQAPSATVHKRVPHVARKRAPLNATGPQTPQSVVRKRAPAHVVRKRAPLIAVGTPAPLNAAPKNVARVRPRVTVLSRFDGLWSVTIYTQSGPCDAAYRYPARIVGNQVVQAENEFGYQINGVVTRNGQISVTVSQAGQSATGYGRLTSLRGGGWWQAAGGQCSGIWMAARRTQ